MLAEFPNKPLQGSKFNKFKNKLMGMNKQPKETKAKSKLQIKFMISYLQNSAIDKPNQIIENRVALHELTGV